MCLDKSTVLFTEANPDSQSAGFFSVLLFVSAATRYTTWHDTSSLPPNDPVRCPTLLPRGAGLWRVLILS